MDAPRRLGVPQKADVSSSGTRWGKYAVNEEGQSSADRSVWKLRF